MSPESFTYWLQGYFEISDSNTLSPQQVQIIRDHLDLVFEKVTPDRKGYDPLDTKFTGVSSNPLCGTDVNWGELRRVLNEGRRQPKEETRYC